MKILIINTDYEDYLKSLYVQFPNLHKKTYQEQMNIRNKTLFGSSDFYSYNLEKIGHQAMDLHFNNLKMQSRWAEENLETQKISWKIKKLSHTFANTKLMKWISIKIPFKTHLFGLNFMETILQSQIEAFKPDMILNQALVEVPVNLLKRIKNVNSKLVGQIASPLPNDEVLKSYDLLISSLPNQVRKFTSLQIPTAYIKLGFDERLLTQVPEIERDLPVVFVGSITWAHQGRVKLLEYLCKRTHIKIWGSLHGLSLSSPIYGCYQGEAWGIEMYKIFQRSKIILNHHIDLSENYANNMRLFEATGCGALLLTDHKCNIEDIFKMNSEVLTYSTFEDCLEKIEYYMKHDELRINIAKAGQKRTLSEHTYVKRMQEMATLLEQSC